MKSQFNSLNLRVMVVLLSILTVLLAKLNPYLSLLLPWYLGFLMISEEDFNFIEKLALAPALGLGAIIFIMHILSWLRVSLRYSYPIIVLLVIALSLAKQLKLEVSGIDRTMILGLLIAVFLSVGIKVPFAQIPAYPGAVGRDAVFHAYKSLEILKESTLFISHVPSYASNAIKTYPAGYHSIITWIAIVSKDNVGHAMLVLKLFTWFILPLATYAVTKQVFNKESGIFAAILMPLSYLYYYYLHYSLLHTFFNYYIFLVSMFFYNLTVQKQKYKYLALAILVISTMLIIHPYSYLLFQAYAGILVVSITIIEKKIQKFAIIAFITQAFGSFLIYYTLEYPMRLKISAYSKPIFGSPAYAFKDNIHWFKNILMDTFLYNGQIFLGVCFFVGVFLLLKHKKTYALILTFVYDTLLILNKIYFHVNIPFYSAIWSSERIYVLLTPVIPVIEGIGAWFIDDKLREHLSNRKVISIFLLFLIIPAFYVNVINFTREKSSVVDTTVLQTFQFINSLPSDSILVAKFHDSGMWIPIFTSKEIKFFNEADGNEKGLLYIDSRGAGDVRISPLNPLRLLGKYQLLYFNSNIWIYNMSTSWNITNTRLLKSLMEYYKLPKDDIIGTDFNDWKYLVYGFVLKNPVVMREIILCRLKFALSPEGHSYIVFVPTRKYDEISLQVIFSKQNQTIQVWINNRKIGEIKNESQTFRYEFEENMLYIIKLKSDEPFGFILLKLE